LGKRIIIELDEDDAGVSIRIGEWIERRDGFWVLRITQLPSTPGDTPHINPIGDQK